MLKKEELRKIQGITLVALIITVVVMLILAGVAIDVTIGDNGLFKKTQEAKEISISSQLKEELELEITDLQLEKSRNGEQVTKEDIAKRLENIAEVDSTTEDKIEGEYKEHPFEIDENNQIVIGDRLEGDKPTGEVEILTTEVGVEEVEIKVTGATQSGEIVAIEAINGAELKEEKSNEEKIFKVKENGTYKFRIKASNRRNTQVSCDITNVLESQKDILTAIKEASNSGLKKVKVRGRTSQTAAEEDVTYSLNVIRHEGDMILDGTTEYEGSTLATNVYKFGDANDVAQSASVLAKNAVVLKVEGNLTINEGVTLAAYGGTCGGPKGLIVYCTGLLTNNGTITMSANGAYATPENVYLWCNANEEGEGAPYEYVPQYGSNGANSYVTNNSNYQTVNPNVTGAAGVGRGTAGGASGGAGKIGYNFGAAGGKGGQGTSYSGGGGRRRNSYS